jgi:hypothetical protein
MFVSSVTSLLILVKLVSAPMTDGDVRLVADHAKSTRVQGVDVVMKSISRYARSRRLPGPRPGQFPLGSLQSRAAARLMKLALEAEAQDQQNAWLKDVTPRERAFMEALGGSVTPAGLMLTRAILEKSRIFGWELPQLPASKKSEAIRVPDAT